MSPGTGRGNTTTRLDRAHRLIEKRFNDRGITVLATNRFFNSFVCVIGERAFVALISRHMALCIFHQRTVNGVCLGKPKS